MLLVAAVLRVWGLGYDLPFVYHPDEPFNVAIVQSIFRTGDLNPHSFVYPTLFYYINSLAYAAYYLGGRMLGVFHLRSDMAPLIELAMGVTKAPDPGIIVLGRMVTAAFGVGEVALVFCVGVRLFRNTGIALLAALMMAIVPTDVALSRYITPDTFVVFFVTASFLAAVLIYREGRPWHYVVAGLLVGLSASAKYNGALALLPVLGAHFLRSSSEGRKAARLYAVLAFGGLGFVAGTPFAVLDFPTFLHFFSVDAWHYSHGHPGMEGDALQWYCAYMFDTAAVLYVLSTLEIVRGIAVRSKPTMLLSIFPVAYFLFISSFVVRNDRTFLPLTPFLFLLAASFLFQMWDAARHFPHPPARRVMLIVVAIVAIAGVLQPGAKTFADSIKLMSADSRETGRLWIAQNLPRGSRIAFESYSPFLEPGRYSILGVLRMTDHDPEWYESSGFQYLILSEGMFGRYFREPERYPHEIAQYERFFRRFHLLKMFDDGNYQVRIYEVRQDDGRALPP